MGDKSQIPMYCKNFIAGFETKKETKSLPSHDLSVAVRTVVAVIAADLMVFCKLFRTPFGREGTRGPRFRKEAAAIGLTMAGFTLCRIMFCDITVVMHP